MPRSLSAQHDRFALNRPFRIARGVKTAADVVTVTIMQDGHVGRGEGVPYPRYGESIAVTLAEIARVQDAIEAGADRQALLGLLRPGAARNAIDCALWDLEAKIAGSTVAALIGAPAPVALASALTVVIDTPEAMAQAAAAIATAPLIKVKVDADAPAAQIRAVVNAAPDAALIVDPNEGWDRAVLENMQDMLVELRVALLEQPVPSGADAWLAGFKSAVPICADELVHTADDLDQVAARYQYVNIKLDKAGGLTAALDLAAAASARGLGLMTGCMVSSSLSIAPALHVARLCAFVDLDGPVWLAEDRPGGVTDAGGILSPPSPGFWGS
ncbi:N-acetyl-D-Glu racemase DgcA [Sphingomonas sp. MMS24-J45]|uniref:N-acetyl-D-Glu racemase DgcA n=1 Tax=Sphingomonas sp. MMS24-J45 TaxID=3238806 RepID=UPI003850D449